MTKDQEIVIFHYRLGVAISQWSYVEASIGDIVISLFPTEDLSAPAVAIALHSAEGFRAKLKFADGIVNRKLAGKPILAHWKKLTKKANTESGRRNNLAHWGIKQYWDCQPGKRVVLRPWVFAKPKSTEDRKKPPDGSLRIMDLVQCAQDFKLLGDSFQEFFRELHGLEAPPRVSPEPIGDPMTVQSLKREIREVFSASQKPSRE